MKCPNCNADMKMLRLNEFGWVIFPEDSESPRYYQRHCPACRMSGPRMKTKVEANDTFKWLTGAPCSREGNS